MSHAEPAHRLEDLAREDGKALSMLTWIGVGAGVVGLVGSIALSSAHPARFYFSWLTAYLYFLSIALGSLFFVLALFVCRAGWSVAFRRLLENTMATLPVFAVLFLPIWFGRHELYEWTHAEEVAKSHLLEGKTGYLNEGFFAIRSVFYLLSWSAIATYFSTQSQRQDESGDEAITRRLQSMAAPSLIVFSLTISFAAIDWIMSLEPEWYSTIYGVYYFAGSVLGAFAFLILGIAFLHARGRLQGVVTVEHVHDVGKLLFGFTVFWTYIGFSQYFLIWYANMPEETAYYMHRSHGSWPSIAKLLIGGHFVLPFFFLMPRAIKRSSALLAFAATWLLAMHYVDMYWCVMPIHLPEGPGFSALDGTATLGVGGFFLAALGWVASRRSLVPLRDPRLAESLSFENV